MTTYSWLVSPPTVAVPRVHGPALVADPSTGPVHVAPSMAIVEAKAGVSVSVYSRGVPPVFVMRTV